MEKFLIGFGIVVGMYIILDITLCLFFKYLKNYKMFLFELSETQQKKEEELLEKLEKMVAEDKVED